MNKVLQLIKSLGVSIRFKKDGKLVNDSFLIVDLNTAVATTDTITECNSLLESQGKSMRLSLCDPKINPKTKQLYPPAIFVGTPQSGMSLDDLSSIIS